MPTRDELLELSKQAAKVAGIEACFEAYRYDRSGDAVRDEEGDVWLFEDSARCFDLACELEINVLHWAGSEEAKRPSLTIEEYDSDHNNDRKQATRVAILRAYLAMKGKS